jgi:hypothetical protein
LIALECPGLIEEWKRSLGLFLLPGEMTLPTQVAQSIRAMARDQLKSTDAVEAPARDPASRIR